MITTRETVRLRLGWGSSFMSASNGPYNPFFCRGKFHILVSRDMLALWCSHSTIDNIWSTTPIDWDYKSVIQESSYWDWSLEQTLKCQSHIHTNITTSYKLVFTKALFRQQVLSIAHLSSFAKQYSLDREAEGTHIKNRSLWAPTGIASRKSIPHNTPEVIFWNLIILASASACTSHKHHECPISSDSRRHKGPLSKLLQLYWRRPIRTTSHTAIKSDQQLSKCKKLQCST